MRKELFDLITESILYKYELPNNNLQIDRSIFSNINDKCFESVSNDSLAEIIYNSIIDYSFNEFDLVEKDYNNLNTIALKIKLKYNPESEESSRISYGFYGEILLYCLLYSKFNAKALISRGYFYNPLEFSETKGYDSYHLIENNDETELWFGEVKFRSTYASGITSAISNIDKVISDEYLSSNFLAIVNHKEHLNIVNSNVSLIIESWLENPIVNIMDVIKKYKIKLIYPIFLLYDETNDNYDESIRCGINYIKNKFDQKEFMISIPFNIYFIWMPVKKVRDIKIKVIQWIELRKPLI